MSVTEVITAPVRTSAMRPGFTPCVAARGATPVRRFILTLRLLWSKGASELSKTPLMPGKGVEKLRVDRAAFLSRCERR
jgi:hypothetical protein